jgi:hypothetical protein
MTPLEIEDLIVKVEQNMNGKVNYVQKYSRRSDAAYVMDMFKDENTDSRERTEQVIDPYTGELLGKRISLLWKFLGIVTYLHTSLLLPSPIGGIIVGSATLIFVVIALSGLCLWLPTNQNRLMIFLSEKKSLHYSDNSISAQFSVCPQKSSSSHRLPHRNNVTHHRRNDLVAKITEFTQSKKINRNTTAVGIIVSI